MSPGKFLAQKLLQINAIKLSPQKPFLWASGLYSPIYCDNRIALSFPDVRDIIKLQFTELIRSLNSIDIVAGVATAGIAHGALVADAMQKPFIYVRSKAKAHGRQNQIEGHFRPGQSCVVIEDLISTGGSVLSAVSALRDQKLKVNLACSIFNYNFSRAIKNFEEAKCPFYSLTDYNTLIDIAVESGYINSSQKEILKTWRENPEIWSSNFKKMNS